MWQVCSAACLPPPYLHVDCESIWWDSCCHACCALWPFPLPLYAGSTPTAFLVLADMGADEVDGGQTTAAMEAEVKLHMRQREVKATGERGSSEESFAAGVAYQTVLHAGDLAYNLDSDEGRVGDRFMEQIEPISASLPYMVSPGNHESHANFSHFRHRFTMPRKSSSANLFYSFDVGLVHFISYNTETYFNMTGNGALSGDGNDCVKAQYNWMKADLAIANANRAVTPWIVVFGHRPMYCNVAAHNATTNTSGCDGEQEQSRNGANACPGCTSGGEPGSSDFAIEDLFHEYGVDVALYGHVHDYSRYLPAYNDRVVISNGTVRKSGGRKAGGTGGTGGEASADVYTDPGATVHFTIGGAWQPAISPHHCRRQHHHII
jgi:predicted phosphohydrolase